MKKRIGSLLLAFLMVASIFPSQAFADDNAASVCDKCNLADCAGHENWCDICGVEICDQDHTAQEPSDDASRDPAIGRVAKITGDFPVLWKTPKNAANQVTPAAGTLPAYVKIVDVQQFNKHTVLYKLDAASGYTWPAQYQNHRYMESTNLTFVKACATCGAYECAIDHSAPAKKNTATDPVCKCPENHDIATGHVATCPCYTCPVCGKPDCYDPDCKLPHPMEGKQVRVAENASLVWAVSNLSNISANTVVAGVADYAQVMVVTAVETVGSVTYYQLKAAPGYSWPQSSNVKDGYWLDCTKLEVVENTQKPCPDCGETDCDGNHSTTTPTRPADEPLVDDASGITVSGDAIPADATLKVSVPNVAVPEGAHLYDIKILREDGTEWQPIDDNTTVTISIPVNTGAQYVDVTHYIDCAAAIREGVEYVSLKGAADVAFTVLADAIAASNKEGYVAVEAYKKVAVVNGAVSIRTDSFSIYEWTTNSGYQKIPGTGEVTEVLFRNDELSDSNRKFEYWASPGQTFMLTTSTGSYEDNPFSSPSEDITLENTRGDFHGIFTGYIRHATVTIKDTAQVGSDITIQFKGTILSGEIVIHIIREVNVTFDKNLETASLTNSTYGPIATDGIRENLFTIPVDTKYIPTTTETQYEFLGWSTSLSGEGKFYKAVYDANGKVTGFNPAAFTPMSDMTLYAMWDAENYVVSYDTNGGEGTYDPMRVDKVEGSDIYPTIKLPTDKPIRKDYEFLGWSASLDGVSKIYEPGEEMEVKSDVVMHAVWGIYLTITVSGGELELQEGDEFSATSLDDHTWNGKPMFTKQSEDGVITYTALLMEGYLKQAQFVFNYNGTTHKVPTVDISDTVNIGAINKTNKTLIGISPNGIVQNTDISISAAEKGYVSYTVSYNTAFGTPVSATIKQVLEGATFDVQLPTTSRTGYTFAGWKVTKAEGNWELNKVYTDTNPAGVYGNATLTAQWTVNSYIATWDVDGSKTTATYTYGAQIAKPVDPVKTGYTFDNWNGYTDGMTMPADNVTFVATWKAAKVNYTVETYKMDLTGSYGEPVETTATEYTGETVTLTPAPETGFSHDASNENNVLSAVVKADGSTVLKVYYSRNKHEVTFDSDGGTTVTTVEAYYGEPISQFEVPRKEGHTFTSWAVEYEDNWIPITDQDGKLLSDSYTMPDQDVALKAQWSVNTYKATWVAGLISNETIHEYGEVITKGADPVKAGYTFIGWSGYTEGMTMPAQNLTFVAQWEAKDISYTVETYIMGTDGSYSTTPNSTKSVASKMDADISASHEAKEGFTADTEKSVTSGKVTVNGAVLKLYYSRNKYTIKFDTDGGTTIADITDYHGAAITKPADPTKAPTAEFSYTFTGWSTAIPATMPIGGLEVKASYAATTRTYTVRWVNEDGTPLETDTVAYNMVPTYDGGTPTKAATEQYTYTFAGWTPAVTNVTGDVTYTATYSKVVNKYTVIWVDENNSQLEVDNDVPYGATPSYNGAVPSKAATEQYTYTFDGWTPAVTPVTGNVTYKAKYTSTVNKYTVTWVDENNSQLEIDNDVPYGATPSYNGAVPTKAATEQYTYTFAGWSPAIEEVTGDVTYTAQFDATVNTYTVTWAYDDGSVYTTGTVTYGELAKNHVPTAPEKASTAEFWYQFVGWTKTEGGKDFIEDTVVTGDVTYYAYFNEVTMVYDIYWLNWDDGSLHTTVDIAYGKMPEYPSNKENLLVGPVVNGYNYIFSGWSPVVSPVDGDASYKAQYTATPVVYKIDYIDTEAGTNPTTYTVEAADFTLVNPEKPGYTFAGWTGTGLTEKTMTVTVPKGTTGDRSYTANWDVITYGITYKLNGGTNAVDNPDTYTVEQQITLKHPTKTGYTFIGWTGTDLTVPTLDVTIEKGSTEARSYTANWQANTYNVVFDANGGEGNMQAQELTYDTTATLTANGFTRTGYTFAGWTTATDGTAAVYQDQQQVKNLVSEADGTITLYAYWQINTVSLTIKTHSADPDQNHVFQVSGKTMDGKAVSLKVAMGSNGVKKIINLPAGCYTIGNEAGWTWRYAAQSLSKDVHTNEVVDFNYTYNTIMSGRELWLNEYGYNKANF